MYDSLRCASQNGVKGQTRITLPDGARITVRRLIPRFDDESLAEAIESAGEVTYEKKGSSRGKELSGKCVLGAADALDMLERFLDEHTTADRQDSKGNGQLAGAGAGAN